MTISVERSIDAHIEVMTAIRPMAPTIDALGDTLTQSLREGHKILFAGNGGSAADAQHLAAEIVGRFEKDRSGLGCYCSNH